MDIDAISSKAITELKKLNRAIKAPLDKTMLAHLRSYINEYISEGAPITEMMDALGNTLLRTLSILNPDNPNQEFDVFPSNVIRFYIHPDLHDGSDTTPLLTRSSKAFANNWVSEELITNIFGSYIDSHTPASDGYYDINILVTKGLGRIKAAHASKQELIGLLPYLISLFIALLIKSIKTSPEYNDFREEEDEGDQMFVLWLHEHTYNGCFNIQLRIK
jgi:hypothetical protein